MISFKTRSGESELMDSPDVSVQLLHKNLGELDMLNRYLGGHAISIKGIQQLITDHDKVYHIVDLGCGSGDVLKYISRWARKAHFTVRLTGVDKNKAAIQYLTEHNSGYPEITGVVGDYKEYLETGTKVDIVHCSLFCHHLDNSELLELFLYLKTYTGVGFVINDLQRSPVAYYSVWFLTRLLLGSPLSKHDGPVSVLRAFTSEELALIIRDAGMSEFSIHWKWAFRFLVVVKTVK